MIQHMDQMMTNAPKKPSAAGWVVAIVVVGLLTFAAGFGVGQAPFVRAALHTQVAYNATSTITGIGSAPPPGTSVDFSEFWGLWNLLEQKYYRQPLDQQKMLYGAMSGLASSLGDPYTIFFDPTSANTFNQTLSGQFDGIGAEVGEQNQEIVIIAPLKGLPADKAGIMAGDIILKIDGKDTSDMSVDQAVSLIRGPKGTKVTLTIGRWKKGTDANGKPTSTPTTQDITITRDTIQVKSVNVTWKGNIPVISISSFDQNTGALLQADVKDILAKNPKGIVLDLRGDPGGYLDQGIDVAAQWIGQGLVVSEVRQGKVTESYNGPHAAAFAGIPTIVLVDGGSASAAEIVSGALQDDGLAKLVGTKTFGKGSVQEFENLPDGSAVKVTIAEWMTPKGRLIDKKGIEPDVHVDVSSDDLNANRDPQLDKAIQLLTGAATATSTPSAVSATGTAH